MVSASLVTMTIIKSLRLPIIPLTRYKSMVDKTLLLDHVEKLVSLTLKLNTQIAELEAQIDGLLAQVIACELQRQQHSSSPIKQTKLPARLVLQYPIAGVPYQNQN